MRTHVTAQDIWDLNPCSDFTLEKLQQGMGIEPITLEEYAETDYSDYGIPTRAEGQKRDQLWVFTSLMSRQERIQLGVDIIDTAELLTPNEVVRDSLVLMESFPSAEQVAAQRNIVETLLLESGQGTSLYNIIDSTRQLLNPSESQKSVMRICRFIEGHTVDSTYQKFTDLAVSILKKVV
jgi:hypothetical protein